MPDVNRKESPFFERSIHERIIVALASPPLAVICAGILLGLHASFADRVARDWRDQLRDFAVLAFYSELIGSFFILLVLAFLWSLFRPIWLERLILYALYHVGQVMRFLFIGYFISFAIWVAML